MESGADFLYVTFAAELTDEAATRFERICDAGDNCFGLFHPVQRGVGKYGVESPLEAKLMAVHHHNIQSAFLSRCKLRKTRIHANHCTAITQLIFSVSAPSPQPKSKIEFSRLRVQQL